MRSIAKLGRMGSLALLLSGLGACATTEFSGGSSIGVPETLARSYADIRQACTARLPGSQLPSGSAWLARRACAGNVTAACYHAYDDRTDRAALDQCLADAIERCEAEFHATCDTRPTSFAQLD